MTQDNDGARPAGGQVTRRETMPNDQRLLALAICIVSLVTGLVLRYLAREHATTDAVTYLIPWYAFARDHGIGGLGEAFTNYTPLYSYLLLLVTRFDGWGQPLSLVKSISAAFECGCAIVAALIVWRATRAPLRTSLAFCGVWLAPTAIFNGAVWGQADSIWTFFVLLSVSLAMQNRNGVLPFAVAVAVKAQGVFLGPFVLGMILRRRQNWAWLAAIPAVYLLLAVPVLIAGRPLVSVLTVYLDQADTFHRLTMNAANIWVLAGGVPYAIGVGIGLVAAVAAGLAITILMMRSPRSDPEFILLAACVSLMLMPFLLPKMHERYFYGFELACIALACINRRYLPVAVIAQVDGVLSYLGFESGIVMGLLPAALCNTCLAVYLCLDLWHGERGHRIQPWAWLGYGATVVALFATLVLADPGGGVSLAYLVAATAATMMTFLLLKTSLSA